MESFFKKEYDKISLINDIEERDKIIEQYSRFGILNRDDAIEKINKLRVSDSDVAKATAVELAKGFIPFEQCTNHQIINELILQRTILSAKLTEKILEDNR